MQAAMLLEIRRAGPKDARAIATVLHQSFIEFRALYTDGGFAATALDEVHVLARMQEGPVWVALGEGVMLGTGAAVVKSESIYIRGMAVLPSARGSGVGKRLLRQIEAWAVSEGYTRLFLSTTPFLNSAIRLYEKSGFRRTDEGLHDLFGTPLFTMEKTVEKTVSK
jgi:putative acetyltransferase